MIRKRITGWSVLTGLLLSLPLAGLAGEQQKTVPTRPEVQKTTTKDNQDLQKSTIKDNRPPVYKPPRRGTPAPGRRIGGGTRGMTKDLPIISVLAPDHIGLTAVEQPDLFWFSSKEIAAPVVFTLVDLDERQVEPVVEVQLHSPTDPGIHRIRMADQGIRLEPGKRYQWSVSIVMDAIQRSHEIIAMGGIERVEPSQALPEDAGAFSARQRLRILAEAGLWYDLMTTLSDLIDAAPTDVDLREERIGLLKQIGRTEVGAIVHEVPSGT